jgi:Tfp pilus assembly protein PilF
VEDDEAAEEVFQQALGASNHKNAHVLGSYAVFRSRVHEDSLDENRKLFERAIDADQNSAPNLAAFAQAQLKHAVGL